MDDFPSLFLIACLVLYILIAPLVALIRSGRAKKRSAELGTESRAAQEQLRQLLGRVYNLEQDLARLHGPSTESPSAAGPPLSAPPQTPPQPSPGSRAEASVALGEGGPSVRPTPIPPKPASPPQKPVAQPSTPWQPAAPTPSAPPQPPPLAGPQKSAGSPVAAAVGLGEGGTHASAPKEPPTRSWADMEERLGANWLNKIGTAAFVIGVALLLNYSMHYLGPVGKITLGYVLAAVMLIVGMIGERKERYRIAGRAVLGGGWALAYFTTYALHNIAAVRLVPDATLGFVLLFLVAAAMVAHSLVYHSEITTGFAYLLAFATIGISTIPLGALVASALLSASLIIVLRMRRWYAIEPFAIAATYIVHWLWLDQIYARAGGYQLFPDFNKSVALLSTYWLIYLVSHFLRDDSEDTHKFLLTISFLLNAVGYLALLHHQSFHPELRFWFLTATGLLYLGVSFFSRKIGRHLGFLLASTLGATLIVAAVPYRYSASGLEILWLVEAEAFLVVGWRLPEVQFRRLGWLASGVLACYVIFTDLFRRLSVWTPPNAKLGWLLLALAAAFYFNSRLKGARLSDATQLDLEAADICPVIATTFLLSAAWVALPFLWVALVWTVIAIALVQTGRRLREPVLFYCGHISALFALIRLLAPNMQRADAWHNVSLRLITVGVSSALFYTFSRSASSLAESEHRPNSAGAILSDARSRIGGFPSLYTAAATLLIATLIWREITTAAISLAWGIFALALLETSRALKDRPLLIQGRILLFASFARIFFADLNSTSRVGPFAAPVVTVSLLAIIYFYVALTFEDTSRFRAPLLWFGTIAFAALIRFQAPYEWVAVVWAAFAILLYFAGAFPKLVTFRDQSYFTALLVGVRCGFDNFYQRGPWHFTTLRIATVVSSAALLYVLFAAAQLTKKRRIQEYLASSAQAAPDYTPVGGLRRFWALLRVYPQHLFFFVPTILLTILISLEVRRSYLTPAWGLEGLIIFLAVLKMDERTYRWFSLTLFLLCVGRIVTVDVWNLDALGRIISFMGLGVVLLAVSFLYARHRELLRRVL